MFNYEKECLKLDLELAKFLGWRDLEVVKQPSKTSIWGLNTDDTLTDVPRWTQDSFEAFELGVSYGINIILKDDFDVTAWYRIDVTALHYDYINFPNKSAACRYAITQAVVNKLKGI